MSSQRLMLMLGAYLLNALATAAVAAHASGSAEPAEAAAGTAAAWSRGDYGVFSMAPDRKSYAFNYSTGGFLSTPGSLDNVTAFTTATGLTDRALGKYDELNLTVGSAGTLSVRYFQRMDAFVFVRRPRTADLPSVWPSFTISNHNTSATYCLGWSDHYFFPGGIHTSLDSCSSNGPLFLFDAPSYTIPPPPSTAMVLSALSRFTSNQVVNCPPSKNSPKNIDACTLGVSAAVGQCKKCVMYESSSLLLARPSLARSIRAFGSMVRQTHNTTRRRGVGVNQLSAWNDNQAAYSWWTVGPDQEVWGKPEDIYVKLKQQYDKHDIPVRSWEPDNNWMVTYKDGNNHGNGTGIAKNWIGRQWDYETELYPSGGEGFVKKMGNISMAYYTNGFNAENSYRHIPAYKMVGKGEMEPHPNTSLLMYSDIIGNAAAKYNMELLFTDFLCYRGPSMGGYHDVPEGEEGEHMWLGGQALAAQAHGVEVQFCMALAHQILMSVEWQSVTNCRVNGDGGLAVNMLVAPSVLAAAVGLGWSKDNLRTADRCYVNATYPNGTVKWPCGSINAGEGTSGKYASQTQQTILATLSLGPVGIADQLSASPYDPSADITSNKQLVMATCSTTGDLLQPSYPLTPVERMISGAGGMGKGAGGAGMDCFGPRHMSYSFGCNAYLMATYTALPAAATSAPPAVFYTAVGWHMGKSPRRGTPDPWMLLFEQDLAPMVDGAAPPAPTLDAIPRGSFAGAGSSFKDAAGSSAAGSAPEHVWWFGDFVHQTDCTNVKVATWGGSVNMSLPFGTPTMVNVAPVMNGAALLGEAGKVTAVSSYRFSSIAAAAGGLSVGLRGKPGELVALLFAVAGKCVYKPTTIGADGTAVAHSV